MTIPNNFLQEWFKCLHIPLLIPQCHMTDETVRSKVISDIAVYINGSVCIYIYMYIFKRLTCQLRNAMLILPASQVFIAMKMLIFVPRTFV